MTAETRKLSCQCQELVLADRTVRHDNVDRPSVTLCIVAKRYILQQKFLNRWIGSAPLGARQYNFQPPTRPLSPQTPQPQNFQHNLKKNEYAIRGVHYAHVMHMQITWYCFSPKFSNAVRSAISATAGLLVIMPRLSVPRGSAAVELQLTYTASSWVNRR